MSDQVTYSTDHNVAGILIAPHAVFSVIASFFVGLRLYSNRFLAKLKWNVDDTVVIIALVANLIMLLTEGTAVPYGLGTEFNTILTTFPGGVTPFLQCILAIECAYGVACPLSKISVLAMYYRIFSASSILRKGVWVMVAMLVGWGIAVVGVSIFSCQPIAGFWNKSLPSTCIDSSKFYIGITVPNIILDLLTIALPLHEVWRLQMAVDRKLAITGVFVLGGSVVLASIARLVLFAIFRPGADGGNNISQTVVFPHAASAIETCLAIIGACLPPTMPFFHKMSRIVRPKSIKTKTTSNDSGKKTYQLRTIGQISNRKQLGTQGSFERLNDSSFQGSTDVLSP